MTAAPPERLRYTIKEAADMLGVSTFTIRRRIEAGKLKAQRDGRTYVLAEELKRYANEGES